MSFQIHPKQTACKTSALSERMRKTQNEPAIWSALRLSVWRMEGLGLLPVLGGTGSMRMGIGRTGKRKVPPDLQGSAIF